MQKRPRFFLLPVIFTAIVFFRIPFARAQPTFSLNLPQAIDYASTHSPQYLTALKEIEIRTRTRKNSVASFFPSLDGSISQGLSGTYSSLSSPSNLFFGSIGLTLTENIYDNGKTIWGLKSAKWNEERAKIELEKAKNQLALQVAQAFYQFSLASQTAAIKAKQAELLREQFKTGEVQYRQGMKTRRDYLRFRARVQRADISLISAENDLKTSVLKLENSIGVEAGNIGKNTVTFTPMTSKREKITFPSEPPSLEKHYEKRIQKIAEKINEVPVRLALRQFLPRANLSAGAGFGSGTSSGAPLSNAYTSSPTFQWNLTFSISGNLLDWGVLRRDWAKAELSRDQSNLSLQQTLMNTSTTLQTLMLDLKRTEQNYQLTQELLNSEEEAFSIINEEYRQGRSSYLDLTTALDSLFDARLSFASIYFSALDKKSQYHYHQGDLYETLTR
jgi:outer membrane protein